MTEPNLVTATQCKLGDSEESTIHPIEFDRHPNLLVISVVTTVVMVMIVVVIAVLDPC